MISLAYEPTTMVACFQYTIRMGDDMGTSQNGGSPSHHGCFISHGGWEDFGVDQLGTSALNGWFSSKPRLLPGEYLGTTIQKLFWKPAVCFYFFNLGAQDWAQVDVSHHCTIPNTFGDDHKPSFWRLSMAYWDCSHGNRSAASVRLGTHQKATLFLGVWVIQKATLQYHIFLMVSNDGILRKKMQLQTLPPNCRPSHFGSQESHAPDPKTIFQNSRLGGAFLFVLEHVIHLGVS